MILMKIVIIGAGSAGLVAIVEAFRSAFPSVSVQLENKHKGLPPSKLNPPQPSRKGVHHSLDDLVLMTPDRITPWEPSWTRMKDPPPPPRKSKLNHLPCPDIPTKIHSCRQEHHSKPRRGNRRS